MSTKLLLMSALLAASFNAIASVRTVEISVADMTVHGGETFWLPVHISEVLTTDSVVSFQMAINYPDDIIVMTETLQKGPVLEPYSGFFKANRDADTGSHLNIGWSGTRVITGGGVLFYVQATIPVTVGDSTRREIDIVPISPAHDQHVSDAYLNEGAPPTPDVVIHSGSMLVLNPGVEAVAGQPRRSEPSLTAAPNPFNASVELRFVAPEPGQWHGMIVNTLGQVLRQWDFPADVTGSVGWTWDGLSDSGVPVSSGAYVAVMTRNEKMVMTRITLLR